MTEAFGDLDSDDEDDSGDKAGIIALLLKKGADPKAKNDMKLTAFQKAVENGDVVAVKAILKAKAEEDIDVRSLINLIQVLFKPFWLTGKIRA